MTTYLITHHPDDEHPYWATVEGETEPFITSTGLEELAQIFVEHNNKALSKRPDDPPNVIERWGG